jgi:hypothetical protein
MFLDGKDQIFPKGVDHHIEIAVADRRSVQAVGERMRLIRCVGGTVDAVPVHVIAPETTAMD